MSFRNPYIPPVTAEQLRSVGIDPSDLYWSADFRCWRFSGELAVRFPYRPAEQILIKLGLVPNPDA